MERCNYYQKELSYKFYFNGWRVNIKFMSLIDNFENSVCIVKRIEPIYQHFPVQISKP